ncbi:SGNH/GDSL hydrolase family protein [Ahniella affigens]|nr:SGNH/GDSL hydrolase family protein [Ahniella affigens]
MRARTIWRACRNLIVSLGLVTGIAVNHASAQVAQVAVPTIAAEPIEVLLAGNSIVYFNNLPAHLEAFAKAAGGPTFRVTMLAGPGHRITQHAAAGVVAETLRQQHFDWLVLQDFGSGWLCGPQQKQLDFQCSESLKAHQQLAEAAQQAGTHVLILGTYSMDAESAVALARNEQSLAQTIGAARVSLASFPLCRSSFPDYRWLAPDGGHPGPDLTAMMAMKLLDAMSLPPTVQTPVQVSAHGFDLKRSPRATVPYHTTNALPLTPIDQWVYAPERLRTLAQCNAETAAAIAAHCGNQLECVGRDPVWRVKWVGRLGSH